METRRAELRLVGKLFETEGMPSTLGALVGTHVAAEGRNVVTGGMCWGEGGRLPGTVLCVEQRGTCVQPTAVDDDVCAFHWASWASPARSYHPPTPLARTVGTSPAPVLAISGAVEADACFGALVAE